MKGRALRIVFFGTPLVAVPCLEHLLAGPHDVVGVVSQPDRPRGRGRKTTPSPVSVVAQEAGVPLLRPERVGDDDAVRTLQEWRPDIGVVVAFGQFIPRKVRALPTCGYLINAHASLLPKYRGASPIACAIMNGETETGISVMRVEKQMDAGAVAVVEKVVIDPADDTAALTEKLSRQAATAIAICLEQVEAGTVTFTDQDGSAATMAPKLGRTDALLSWKASAREIKNRIHAMAPKPGGIATLDGEPFHLVAARAMEDGDVVTDAPGVMRLGVAPDDPPLRVATGEGWIVPLVVQRPGSRAMATAAYLRGRPIADGTKLADGA